jgi:RNA polymerase sigma factor (TIGR02999 family)
MEKPAKAVMTPAGPSAGGGSHEVTELLRAWSDGDEDAFNKLLPLVYDQLHRIAQRYIAAERTGHPLQPTELVHETFLRLVDTRQMNWEDRVHFLAVSARFMRRVLVDFARRGHAAKRGGKDQPVPLEQGVAVSAVPVLDLIALDEALNRLQAFDPRRHQVVELRFFGGLSVEETAEVLKVSPETIMHDWKLAKAWLLRELAEGKTNAS